jgi:hypothetical protein
MNTHLLPVPFEIAEVINSFAYYDWNTWIRIEKERLFMKDLIYRMVHCYNNPMDNDDPELWVCWLGLTEDEELQYQAMFCKKCGNYISRGPPCTC